MPQIMALTLSGARVRPRPFHEVSLRGLLWDVASVALRAVLARALREFV